MISGFLCKDAFNRAATCRPKLDESKVSRSVSRRFTGEERAELKRNAGRKSISAYIRDELFRDCKQPKRRRTRKARQPNLNDASLALVLGVLDSSGVAGDLQRLADAGALAVTPDVVQELRDACSAAACPPSSGPAVLLAHHGSGLHGDDGLWRRGPISERGVRPDSVVMTSPQCDEDFGHVDGVANLAVEQFVAQAAVKALDVSIFPRASRRDEGDLRTDGGDPVADSLRHELWATNSGPSSERMRPGAPRRMNKSDRTSMTSAALSVRPTRIAKLSRVNSSRTQSILTTRPSAARSWTKS